jgi:hypothetical protein
MPFLISIVRPGQAGIGAPIRFTVGSVGSTDAIHPGASVPLGRMSILAVGVGLLEAATVYRETLQQG